MKDRNRILMILHLPPPIHGAAQVGKYIFNSDLINKNFCVKYLNLSFSSELHEIGKVNLRKIIYLFKLIFQISWQLLFNRPGLCYLTLNTTGSGFYKDFIFVMVMKIFRVKVIYHLHNKGVSARQNYLPDDLLYKTVFRNSKVILMSKLLYPDISKYVSADDVYICPNGIDNSNLLPVKNYHPETRVSVLYLSNMMRAKGVMDLLEAMSLLKNRNCNVEVHFAGKWSDVNEDLFNERVHGLGLDRIVFAHGPVYGEEKSTLYGDADIFAFPSHDECFPLVLLEAMKFGLPVVCTDVGGIPDIVIDGITGLLFPAGDIGSLAEKLELLINDHGMAQQMGKAGRKRFEERFTLGIFEENLKKTFLEVLKK